MCSGLVVACLTALWKTPGSNLTADSYIHYDSHYDMQPWYGSYFSAHEMAKISISFQAE